MKKSVINVISISAIVLSVALGSVAYIYRNILNVDTIYKGVTIDGYDVNDKTMEQALNYIKAKKESEIKEKSMNLIYGKKVYKIDLEKIGFSYDYNKAVKTAFKLGRQGNFINRLRDIMKIKNGIEVPLESSYQYEKIENIVNNISQEINMDSVDAILNFNKGKITIDDEVIGNKLKKDELISKIEENIFILRDIDIPVENIQPILTKDFLSRINGIIGEFTTSFK